MNQKKYMINNARKLANLTYSVIERSVNKILIGKAYWKQIALPSILHCLPVIHLTKTDIDTIQKVENSVYRKMLGAQRYAPVCALRGEIGSSLMETRNLETKLNYYRYAQTGDNALLKNIMDDMEIKKMSWYLEIEKQMEELQIDDIQVESKNSIKMRAREKDNEKWQRELNEKSSLKIYKMMKPGIEDEEIYDNKFDSVLWFKARTNTLQLEDRKRFSRGDVTCKVCGAETEDIFHFVLECCRYDNERGNMVELQRPYNENKDDLLGNFLFKKKNIMLKKKYIAEIWKIRKRQMENTQ